MMGGLDGIWFLRSDKRTYEFAFHVSDNQIRQNVDLILNLIDAVSTGKVSTGRNFSDLPTNRA